MSPKGEYRAMEELLVVNNLKTHFHRYEGVVRAVDGISYQLNYGETLTIVGESGSGKTVSALFGTYKKEWKGSGWEAIEGRDLLKLNQEELRQIRVRIFLWFFKTL